MKAALMRSGLAAVAAVAFFGCASAQTGTPATSAATGGETVAFVDVNVVPMDRERVIPNQTVIVRNGMIAQIGPTARVQVPANATRVNATGKYLMPGLAEMHGHITGPNAAYSPENVLFLYIAGGATTVRGMQGQPAHLELRKRVDSGELIGPRLYLSSPPISGNNAATPAAAEQLVRNAKAAGYDHLKVHEGIPKDSYDAIVRTARELGLHFGGHVSVHVGVRGALEAKQNTIDHLDDYIEGLNGNEANIGVLARATKDAGVAVVPTMPLWEVILGMHNPATMTSRPELRYVPAAMRQGWANTVGNTHAQADQNAVRAQIGLRNRMLKALSDAGATIMLGSDAPQLFSVPGFSLQREMETMVEAGMSPFQVLQSGTINVARYYGLEREAGTVEVGRRADLLLLDGNPLQDVRHVARKSGVMIRGKWLEWSVIQQRLDEIAAAYR